MKTFTLPCVLAAVALSASPAQAETAQEIDGYFEDIWKYAVPPVDACAAGNDEFDQCGRMAEDLICSVNAMYFVLEESGMMGRFARDLTELNEQLSRHAGYFEEMIEAGEMRNPATMPTAQMQQYCRQLPSTIFP